MTLAWFQCPAGASGDMLLGALIDAGAGLDVVQTAVDAVGTEPIRIETEEVTRGGMSALQVHVHTDPSPVVRTWGNVRRLLEDAELGGPGARRGPWACSSGSPRAEATAHRTPPSRCTSTRSGRWTPSPTSSASAPPSTPSP